MANKRIKDLATTITAFRTGDVIPVDGPSGTAKMTNDNLLKETAQNALAGNVAPAFDPTKPNDDEGGYAYYKNQVVVYQGATYKFKVNHSSGAWNAAEVEQYNLDEKIKHFVVTDNPEYLYAITDINGVFLFGVKKDGTVEWQTGVPTPVYNYINNFITSINQSLSTINSELEQKVDAEEGKGLISTEVSGAIKIVSNSEYVYAILDSNDKFLFGIRNTGEVDWQEGVPAILSKYFSSVSDVSSKEYVDEKITETKTYADGKVLIEKSRAENSEEVLQNQISSIAPVVINGGTFTNYPDGEYLESNNNLISFRSIPSTIHTIGKRYVHSGESLLDVVVLTNTMYIIKDYFDLDSQTLTMPQNCTLVFDGGMIDNGELVGSNTKIIYKNTAIGKDLELSGTWNVPYISSELVEMTIGDCKELKKLLQLCNDSLFNVVHIIPGDYNITMLRESDRFMVLPSNIRLVIDGNIIVNPNQFEGYAVLYSSGKENIEITGKGCVQGDADEHDYSHITYNGTHAWGHCVHILAKNVHIHDFTFKDATGDGIFIGAENCVLENLEIHHCGRQAITLTDGCYNVKISNCFLYDIYRTSPEYGIDIEPNNNIVKNIEIENVVVHDCFGGISTTRVDGLVVRNIEVYACTAVMAFHDSSNVKIERLTSHDNNQSSFFRLYDNCENISISSSVFEADTIDNAFVFHFEGLKVGLDIVLEGLVDTVGSPVEGSLWYDKENHVLQYYNGTNWIDIGG